MFVRTLDKVIQYMNVFVTDLGLGDSRFYSNGREVHTLETCDAVVPGKASSRFWGSAVPNMAAHCSEMSIISDSRARCHIVWIVTPCSLVSGYQHLDRCARCHNTEPLRSYRQTDRQTDRLYLVLLLMSRQHCTALQWVHSAIPVLCLCSE
jgi:hypothetical protein